MRIRKLVCAITLVFIIAAACCAMEKRSAQIMNLDGSAEVRRAGQTVWEPAAVGLVLNEGDAIKTAPKSWVLLNIDNGKIGTAELNGESQMLIAELQADAKEDLSATLLDLAIGEVMIKARKVHGENSKFEVKTPTSIVGVRGTTFNVKVEAVKE